MLAAQRQWACPPTMASPSEEVKTMTEHLRKRYNEQMDRPCLPNGHRPEERYELTAAEPAAAKKPYWN